jgi:hypothetical protein
LKERYLDDKDVKVIETGEFTWLTSGAAPGTFDNRPRVSEVDGVEEPGNEFMRDVFRLRDREVGVAFNAPKTVAYVVQVFDASGSSPDALRADFTARRYSEWNPDLIELAARFNVSPLIAQGGYAIVSIAERNDLDRRLEEQLEKSFELTWERDPRAISDF